MSLIKVLNLICLVILLFAMLPLPYIYYILLRVIISVIAVINFIAIKDKSRFHFWKMFFIATIILFNPIIPIYQAKEEWVVVDLLFSVIFGINAFTANRANAKKESHDTASVKDKFLLLGLITLVVLFVVTIITKNAFLLLFFLALSVWGMYKTEPSKEEKEKRKRLEQSKNVEDLP